MVTKALRLWIEPVSAHIVPKLCLSATLWQGMGTTQATVGTKRFSDTLSLKCCAQCLPYDFFSC